MTIRQCREDDRESILALINAAAEAYRGVIPADFFHDPYMSASELAAEITAGVRFWGYEADGVLVGVMGIQAVLDVDLIRLLTYFRRISVMVSEGRCLYICAR